MPCHARLSLLKSIYSQHNPLKPQRTLCVCARVCAHICVHACVRGKGQADSKIPRDTQDKRPSVGKRPSHSHARAVTAAQAEATASRPAPATRGLLSARGRGEPAWPRRAAPQRDLGQPVLPGPRWGSSLTPPLAQGCRQCPTNWGVSAPEAWWQGEDTPQGTHPLPPGPPRLPALRWPHRGRQAVGQAAHLQPAPALLAVWAFGGLLVLSIGREG